MTQLRTLIAFLMIDPSEAVKRQEGQTLAEYALILALIAVAVVGIVVILGGKIGDLFDKIGSNI